jgi:hypothetical protein
LMISALAIILEVGSLAAGHSSPTEVKTRIPLQKDPEGVSFCKYKWWVCFFISFGIHMGCQI